MSADHGGGHGGGGGHSAPKASGGGHGGGGDHGGGAKKGGKSHWGDTAAFGLVIAGALALCVTWWAPTGPQKVLAIVFKDAQCAQVVAQEVMARPTSMRPSALEAGADVKFVVRSERLSPTFTVPVNTNFAVVSTAEYKVWSPTGWLKVPAGNRQIQLSGAQYPTFRLEGSEKGQVFRLAVSK